MALNYNRLLTNQFGCRDEDGLSKNNWKEKLKQTMNQWKKCHWSKFKWSSTVSPLWHGEGFVSSNDGLHHRGLKVADLSYLWLFGCFSCCQFWILHSGTDGAPKVSHSCQHNFFCLTWSSSQVSTTFLAIDLSPTPSDDRECLFIFQFEIFNLKILHWNFLLSHVSRRRIRSGSGRRPVSGQPRCSTITTFRLCRPSVGNSISCCSSLWCEHSWS